MWPERAEDLVALQSELGRATPNAWRPREAPAILAACFFCDDGAGRAWAAAAMGRGHKLLDGVVVEGQVLAPYQPGLLALREGRLLARAVESLSGSPQALVVNATGRDHPRRCGLALHLGAALDLPSIGVTDRPLVADGETPGPERGDRSPLVLAGETVGYRLRSRRGTHPIAVHAGWRTTPERAVEIAVVTLLRARTPQLLRAARRTAREARAARPITR
ncbi:MAG: endonuclease V [Actinomycetota bacterium]